MKFKHIPFITALAMLLFSTGCLTPKKMDGWIEEHSGGFTTKLKTSDYIVVKTPELPKSDAASVTAKGKYKILPLLVYWKFENSWVPTLNPYIPVATINSTIIQYANSKKLKEKLNGQKLELTVDKVPVTFSLISREHLVFFVVYYAKWGRVFIDPAKQDITFNYRLLKEGVETKKGAITIADPSKPLNLKFLESVKKMTWNYLDEYDNMIRDMSRQLVDKLMAEM